MAEELTAFLGEHGVRVRYLHSDVDTLRRVELLTELRAGVELVKGDLFEQRFKARMRVQNPNDRSIAVRGVSYTLQIGGEDLGRGLSGSSFTVPALGEAEFDMLVTMNLAGTLMRLLERARSDGLPDSLSYRLRGEVKLAEGLVRTIPFDEKGSVRLR